MKSDLSYNDGEGEKNKEKARRAALRKLSSRDRTEKEISDVLCQWGCSREETAEIIDEFRELGYLDDERYCLRYYEYAKSRGKASDRIIRELISKGVPMQTARAALDNTETDDRAAALSVAFKMAENQQACQKPLDEKFMARVGRRLSSLGYNSGICYYAIGKIREYSKDKSKEDE